VRACDRDPNLKDDPDYFLALDAEGAESGLVKWVEAWRVSRRPKASVAPQMRPELLDRIASSELRVIAALRRIAMRRGVNLSEGRNLRVEHRRSR